MTLPLPMNGFTYFMYIPGPVHATLNPCALCNYWWQEQGQHRQLRSGQAACVRALIKARRMPKAPAILMKI